jgi:hypothetical protein
VHEAMTLRPLNLLFSNGLCPEGSHSYHPSPETSSLTVDSIMKSLVHCSAQQVLTGRVQSKLVHYLIS